MSRPRIPFVPVWLLLLILSAGLVGPATAQEAQPAAPAVQQAPTAQPPEKEEVTTYRLSPEKYRQAVDYSRARYRLYFIGFVYGVIVLLVVLAGRVAPRLRDLAERASGRRFVQALVYAPLLFLTVDVLGLPTALYGHWLSRKYEQSSLPVLMLFFALFGFLAAPLFNSYSRMLEHDADVYGLEVTHGIVPDSAQTAAEAFQILGEINLADPEPSAFIKVWLYSHPPLGERLVFASEYDPWSKGEPPQFVREP